MTTTAAASDTGTGQVFTRQGSVNGKTYQIEYVHTHYTVAALERATPVRRDDAGLQALTTPVSDQRVEAHRAAAR
jgi:hypothetical protein